MGNHSVEGVLCYDWTPSLGQLDKNLDLSRTILGL